MKKFGLFVLMVSLAAGMSAQYKTSVATENGILNHLDIGVNVGTLGLGIEVAMPVGEYVRVRAGYNYMPRFTFHSDFNVETRSGGVGKLIEKVGKIDEKLAEYGIDLNDEGYAEYKEMFDKFSQIEAKDYVTLSMKPTLHQFKFMVDVLPFKNKHWSFTAGFYAGPAAVADAVSLDKESLLLEAINTYNDIYAEYPVNGINGTWLHAVGKAADDPFYKYGMAGFSLGTFKDGDKAMMVPGADNRARGEMRVSKVRPYLGVGYNTHLSRDKRWKLNVDAGILFLCGAPSIYVDNVYKFDASSLVLDKNDYYVSGIGVDSYDKYYGEMLRYDWDGVREKYIDCSDVRNGVDLVRDLKDIPGKAGDIIDVVSKVKVYPNLSVGVSYRIF